MRFRSLASLARYAASATLGAAGLYARLYVKTRLWAARSRLAFRLKVRRLPPELAEQLYEEYSRALGSLVPPGPLGLARALLSGGRGGRRGGEEG